MNLSRLALANEYRRRAHAAGDCPVWHAAADSCLRLLVSENNDAVLLARAEQRLARKSRRSLPPGSLAALVATRIV